MFYLTTHNTFYLRLYGVGHMVKYHSEETRCCHMGYSFRLTARVLLYAPSHRQDSTYHSLCYTIRVIAQWVRPMKDRPDDPSHHEWTLLPRSYISLPYINDALNTFYLVIWHSTYKESLSERGNTLLSLHGLLFRISSKGSFIYTIPQIG